MSTIENLTIQGIRSFGTKSDDVQSISFSSPVTLILGENGCGKTTIIECLKYALTGETPPGSNRGQNFIHDPKIFDFSESLGQIKLMVRNIRDEKITVCRSMKIGHKRGKMSFETLDATMNYMTGGQVDSISKRCVDVDVAMCQFMGVSKAIINNVIFCHQEDSSWPLDEAKKLKEKFDAIFGITEYNKAIEKIIKMRKEQMDDLKLKETNLKYLSHLKQEMEDKTMCLQKANEKCDNVQAQCARFDAEMKPIDDRLLEIRKVEYEVGKQQALKVELETKQQNCREQIFSIEKKIKKQFVGNLHQLDSEIRSFDQKMKEKQIERHELEEKLSDLNAQDRQLQKYLVDFDKKRSSVIQQRQKEQDCNSERAEKMKTLCEHLDISISVDIENSPHMVPEVLEDIQLTLSSEQCRISDVTAKHDSEDQDRQTQIDLLRVEMTKLEENITSLRKQKEQQEKETQTIERKISDTELSAVRLKKVTTEIERITNCYNETSASLNQDALKQTIAAGKANINRLQDQFRKIDEQLTFLNSISKLTAEISLKEKELEKKEQEVRRVKSKHSDNFKKLFDRNVEANFKRTLQVIYENLRRQIKEFNEKLTALRLKEQSCNIKRKNLKDEIARSEKELGESKDKIYEKCHSSAYDDLLTKSKDVIAKHQLEHGALRSSEAMYKKYMNKIEEDPCCPLCHKGMSGDEVSDVAAELSEEIHRLPENIIRIGKLLKAEQKKYEGLLQLQPVIEKVARLEEEIPKRKAELRKIEDELAECANDGESFQMLLAEPTSNLDLANTMLGDMSLLDEAIKEVSRIKNDVEKLKNKLPQGSDSDVSIDDLQLEKTTVSAELENERTNVEKMQSDFEKAAEALNKLQEKKIQFKEEQIKLQEGIQSLPQYKERLADLTKQIESNAVQVKNGVEKVQPLKRKLTNAINEKSRLKEANRKTIAQMQQKFDSYIKIDHDIQRLNKEVTEYAKLNLSEEIERLKVSMKRTKDEAAAKSAEISKTSDCLEAVKVECLNQESLERDLKDNRELKVLQEKADNLEEEHKQLSKILGELDFRKVSKEKDDLIRKRDAATVRKGELLGQMGEIKNQINKLQTEIDQPKYKDSIQNYRRSHYEVEVTKRMIADLGQYRVALEWSLMKFHSEKMEKINRLIREYWRQIYRGNDIDYIQIQTDEMKMDSSADRKRNYNYRVVQSKNNSEIEMRGRCSAGQRVLASLIIRMALAETFSSNCGVLALDEPTTNLDRVNILSLCEALNRIVDERQTQSNFMLIIITHDEDFISTLGKINSYHRVFRNDDGKSVIRKVKVA